MKRFLLISGLGAISLLVTACSPGMLRTSRQAFETFAPKTIAQQEVSPKAKLVAQAEIPSVPVRFEDKVSPLQPLKDAEAIPPEEGDFVIVEIDGKFYVISTEAPIADDPA